jgi:putative ABC transport system ATP-binding protein
MTAETQEYSSTYSPNTDSSAIVSVQNVHKTYVIGDDVKTHALRGISVDIEKAEFTAIAGPSGSGKTTLLNLIGCLDTPDEGSVLFDGENIGEMSETNRACLRRDRIGFIFQAYNLVPVLTALENVEFVMMLQGVSEADRKARAEEVLEDVGLGEYMHRKPTEMSGGQQQRIAVARAIAAEPALILADEPTANVDSETGGSLLDMMREMNEKKGITFVFSTHDVMVMERARRLVHVRDGVVDNDELRG